MRPGIVTAWRMRRELGVEIAHRIYVYLVQKYPLGIFLPLPETEKDEGR